MSPGEWKLVRFLADRVRQHQKTELWSAHIAAVKEAWKHEHTREEAQVVIDAYPDQFRYLKG